MILPLTYSSQGRPKSLLAKLAAQPGVRALILFLVFFVIALLYGYTYFYRDPASIFFDAKHAYGRQYSAQREVEAIHYIEGAAFGSPGRGYDYQKASDNASICIGIPTISRLMDRPYIETTLGAMLQSLTPAERSDINVQVFFANADPTKHATYTKPWTSNLVDRKYSYKSIVNNDRLAALATLEAEVQAAVDAGNQNVPKRQEKSIADYTTALEQCYESSSAPYIAIFEDDVLLAEGWLARTLLALQNVEKTMRRSWLKTDDQWLFMRLFNRESNTSWATRKIGGNNEFLITIIVDAFLMSALVALKRRSYVMRANFDNWALAVICFLAVPSFIVLLFQAGKASIFPPKPGVREENFGCCSQGLVYQRSKVPGLVNYLRDNQPGQYDLMTQQYARERKLAQFALYPVQIQHIGIRSASQTTVQEAQTVWSMAYEDLEAEELKKQHFDMVEKFYGDRGSKPKPMKHRNLSISHHPKAAQRPIDLKIEVGLKAAPNGVYIEKNIVEELGIKEKKPASKPKKIEPVYERPKTSSMTPTERKQKIHFIEDITNSTIGDTDFPEEDLKLLVAEIKHVEEPEEFVDEEEDVVKGATNVDEDESEVIDEESQVLGEETESIVEDEERRSEDTTNPD